MLGVLSDSGLLSLSEVSEC